MPTNDHQEQFADELLSAYLDGELTDSERAEVEARLAGDPAAQRVLEDLRAVSQAVRELPPAPAATGLRENVLSRIANVEVRRHESAAADGQQGRESPIRVGRTWRGWAWAGLAVAAALALMIYGERIDQGEGNVDLASREVADRPASPLSIGPPPDATEAPVLLKEEERGTVPAGEIDLDARRLGETFDFAPAELPDLQSNDDRLMESQDRAPEPSAAAIPPSASVSGPDRYEVGTQLGVPFAPASGVLLVRVNMPASARRSMEFERTLAQNQIIVEELLGERELERVEGTVEELESLGRDTRPADGLAQSQPQRTAAGAPEGVSLHRYSGGMVGGGRGGESVPMVYRARSIGQQQAADGSPVEVIVAEAPLSNVVSCLSQIENDRENFLALEVEQPPQPANQSADMAVAESSGEMQQTFNVDQFNRGQVPAQQRLAPPIRQKLLQLQQEVAPMQAEPASATPDSTPDAAAGGNYYVYFFLGTEPNSSPPAAKKARAE